MSVEQIAAHLNKDPFDAVFDLTLEEKGRLIVTGGGFDNPMDEDSIAHSLSDPNCSVASDIVGADFKSINPVAYGAFTKVLGRIARDAGVMTQEEAVRKMTSLPAKQMGLKDRGVIRKGAYADITIFNPGTVIDRASFGNPYQFSEGIEHVLINGTPVVERGRYEAGAFAGKVLRRT